MANQKIEEFSFELDYLFDTGKDIFSSFKAISVFYGHLHDFDRSVLNQIHKDLRLEYRLENVEYGSLKTKVFQVLKGIPDELLINNEILRAIGILLLKAKYHLLLQLADQKVIDSKNQIESIANKINRDINEIGRVSNQLTTSISTLAIFKAIDEINQETNKLPAKESYRFKSQVGNAILRSGAILNKPKILSELGNKNEISDTTVIVKPKKVDLLGQSKWECILNGRTREMKVEDNMWLDKYHKREIDIQSGDSLRVQLRTTYGYDLDSKTKTSYDIIKILAVIKPNNSNQLTIDDNN